MKLKSGKKVQIQSYKHDGSLHRVWISTYVLDDTMHFLATGNQATKVIEADGRTWFTKEPAICYFYEKEWFNVIAMLKKDGIHYYCNISSPYLYDSEAIKYIDYDLDVKVYPNGKMFVLDEKDYETHKEHMNYSEDINKIIADSLETLKTWIIEKRPPFDGKTVKQHYEVFKHIIELNKEKKMMKPKPSKE